MALCLTNALAEYSVDSQNCFEEGRIVAMAFFPLSYTFADITDPAEWATLIADSDLATKAHVIKNVRGSKPRPQTQTAPGVGSQETQVVGATHTVSVFVTGLKDNAKYWNGWKGKSTHQAVFVVGSAYDKMLWVNRAVSIDGGSIIEESTNSRAGWDVQITWGGVNESEYYDVPAGIFV